MLWKIERKTYETRKEKRRDFLIGFVGWFVVNALLIFLLPIILSLLSSLVDLLSIGPGGLGIGGSVAAGFIPDVIIVGGLIYLGFKRKWIAFGALAAIGAVLLVQLIFIAACYYVVSSSF